MFSRTAIREWLVAVLGLLVTLGVDLPVEEVVALFDNVWTHGAGLIALVWSAVGLWLRKVTARPLSDGFKVVVGVT